MDRRTKYTKQVIKDTFLNLLETKDITNITVTEICNEADINRATFYRYYIDIYDLLNKVEEEFTDELKSSPLITDVTNYSIYSFTKDVLEVLYKNKKLVKILFNTNRNLYFLNDVMESAYLRVTEKWYKKNNDTEEIERSAIFVFNGALGIINTWVKNDFDTEISVLAKSVESICLDGIKKYL